MLFMTLALSSCCFKWHFSSISTYCKAWEQPSPYESGRFFWKERNNLPNCKFFLKYVNVLCLNALVRSTSWGKQLTHSAKDSDFPCLMKASLEAALSWVETYENSLVNSDNSWCRLDILHAFTNRNHDFAGLVSVCVNILHMAISSAPLISIWLRYSSACSRGSVVPEYWGIWGMVKVFRRAVVRISMVNGEWWMVGHWCWSTCNVLPFSKGASLGLQGDPFFPRTRGVP